MEDYSNDGPLIVSDPDLKYMAFVWISGKKQGFLHLYGKKITCPLIRRKTWS